MRLSPLNSLKPVLELRTKRGGRGGANHPVLVEQLWEQFLAGFSDMMKLDFFSTAVVLFPSLV